MKHRIALGLILACNSSALADGIDFSPVTEPIGDFLDGRADISGAGLFIAGFDGTILHEQYWGDHDRQTAKPIASASKWLSAAAAMSVVDDGFVGLDTPLEQVLPEFAGNADGRGDVTLRQMFSHTSGMVSTSATINNRNITMQQAVATLAQTPNLMVATPGGRYSYGGVSMHVGGRMIEVAAGTDWESLVNARIATPLGASDLTWDGLGETTNPRPAGGAATSLDTYANFLIQLANHGGNLLSPEAAWAMFTDQVGDTPLGFVPADAQPFQGYGLGSFVLRRDADGVPIEFASPGAFGTFPWIDFENEYVAVFHVDNRGDNPRGLINDLRAFAQDRIDPEPDIRGDANRDGVVSILDFAVLRGSFGTTPGRYIAGDLDGNAVVNILDFAILRANFGNATAADIATLDDFAATVPEPSTGALLLPILSGLRRRRTVAA